MAQPSLTDPDRLRDSHRLLLEFAERLVETHGPIAQCETPNAAFSPLELYTPANPVGTFVSFSSLQLNFPLPPREFHHTLADKGYSILHVKDFARVWYQKGLIGLSETRTETVTALRTVLAKLPRPWTFIGTSSGGYAALYFGNLLQADRICAFSPQTLVDRHTFTRFTKRRPFELGFKTDDPENDLLQFLANAKTLPETRVFYGAPHHKDRRQAQRLDGISGLTLHEIDAKTHNVAAVLKDQGALNDALF